MRYVVPIQDLGRESVPTAGGKGANLGEMLRAGLPVPPGFVVTTDAAAPTQSHNGKVEPLAVSGER
jgi:phosphoenolpyruvate synthase/pyruvate phosphate dikinase